MGDRSPSPLVTVVMTVFNGREFVTEAIQSALDQNYSNIELIVVDDRSDDGTFEEVCRLANLDRRIRLLQTETRGGTYKAKNLGISQAMGELVTFQDADDLVSPHRINAQVTALLMQPSAVASVCLYARFNESEKIVLNRGRYARRSLISLMFRRTDVLERLGFFDEVWTSADDEYIERLRLVFGANRLVELPMPLYFARSRTDSLTHEHRASLQGGEDIRSSLSDTRREYFDSYKTWHADGAKNCPYLRCRAPTRRFPAPAALIPPSHSPSITASLASIPGRVSMLRRVVDRLLPQVDKLNVYLNHYSEVPQFLNRERISVARSLDHGDLQDNGKFFFLNSCNDGIYFTVDDDIDYAPDHVARLQAKLDLYQHAVVVGLHGAIFTDHFERYNRDREMIYFWESNDRDRVVHLLGTGTSAFYRTAIELDLSHFETAGMADIWLARKAHQQCVPMIVIAKPSGFAQHLTRDVRDTLWTSCVADDDVQSRLVREAAPWPNIDEQPNVEKLLPSSLAIRHGWRSVY